ncbi:hypothetical protein MF271_15420 [Deinococcus sp. KNUC1210]|uniref:hypothetical protein n=1 Tax=Deinococcus sp. KNUC1210 TaxID=2917691 RepID=UPI001EF07B6A|nr:hypothetical protein [Deinococcus sp. KNUC1210]ULH15315.1 hypothetical protein MF271_15420 [Deinococcus sp. KNUC1210]
MTRRISLQRASRLFSGRVVLWLAATLFALQVGLHAAMPAGMNMPQMVASLLEAAPVAHVHEAQMNMAAMPPDTAPTQTPAPLHPGTHHLAQSLCCMPPLALLPLLWTPPLLPLIRLHLRPPRAVQEALRILRATARGPPEQM